MYELRARDGKGGSLRRSFILFCLTLWAAQGGKGEKERGAAGRREEGEEREEGGPMGRRRQVPCGPNVTLERGAICPLTSV